MSSDYPCVILLILTAYVFMDKYAKLLSLTWQVKRGSGCEMKQVSPQLGTP